MHRSGTSALSGALEALGLTVGKTVMPPHSGQGNPKGFFENLALTDLHDKFLKAIGSNWDDAQPVRNDKFSGGAARRFQKELPQLLMDEFGAERPLIKDPRMCRLLPLWQPLFAGKISQSQFILPIRDPVEVAWSLHKRDQLPMGQGLKLWVVHVLEGEKNTRRLKRFFTTYDELVNSPLETVAGLAEKLGLPSAAVAATVSGRVDATLRHHKERPWPEGEPHENLTRTIYQTLISADSGQQERLDSLRGEYYSQVNWKL